jgi:hypothetical protein
MGKHAYSRSSYATSTLGEGEGAPSRYGGDWLLHAFFAACSGARAGRRGMPMLSSDPSAYEGIYAIDHCDLIHSPERRPISTGTR